jgi:hypothetical protein
VSKVSIFSKFLLFTTAVTTSMSALRLIPSSGLHVSRPTHWLTSRFHFSFADYYDPARENFGVLRVLNDDLVTPEDGFGMFISMR